VAQPVRGDGGAVKWQKISDYCITADGFNVCCVYIDTVPLYEVWDVRERPHRRLAAFGTPEEAKREARRQGGRQSTRVG